MKFKFLERNVLALTKKYGEERLLESSSGLISRKAS